MYMNFIRIVFVAIFGALCATILYPVYIIRRNRKSTSADPSPAGASPTSVALIAEEPWDRACFTGWTLTV